MKTGAWRYILIASLLFLVVLLSACGGEPNPTGTSPTASSGNPRTVTLSDDTKTITLRVGERLLLQLGNEYEWIVEIPDETIISRVTNITVVSGAQGVYEARHRGSTMLVAAGDPPCLKENPPCQQQSTGFQIDVVVQ
jgi:hypothetical protein